MKKFATLMAFAIIIATSSLHSAQALELKVNMREAKMNLSNKFTVQVLNWYGKLKDSEDENENVGESFGNCIFTDQDNQECSQTMHITQGSMTGDLFLTFSDSNSNTASSFDAAITGGTDGFANAVGFAVVTPIDLDTGHYDYDINYNILSSS
mmetsp:Transcript_25157/g.28993  ORF Transcript_25157/g.28993 Transcript_25157/m.28993 type:complete len:153 (+) Transcript_25157:90-548(+)